MEPKRFMVFALIIAIMVASVTTKKKKKGSMDYTKCSLDFLTNALEAAQNGEEATALFLIGSLNELGFSRKGIRSKTVATAWHSLVVGLSSGSVFSQLQKIGMMPALDKDTICDEEDKKENDRKADQATTTLSTIQSDEMEVKKLTKVINRIYRKSADNDDVGKMEKRRNRRVEKLLQGFVAHQVTSKVCTVPTTPTSIEKKKSKKQTVEYVRTCLRMIDELIQKNLCEEIPESFKIAYEKVKMEKNKTSSGNAALL